MLTQILPLMLQDFLLCIFHVNRERHHVNYDADNKPAHLKRDLYNAMALSTSPNAYNIIIPCTKGHVNRIAYNIIKKLETYYNIQLNDTFE